jgi:glycerate dehydrogenase
MVPSLSPAAGADAPRAVFLDALSLGPVDLAPIAAEVHLTCWPSTAPEERLPRLQGTTVAITNKVRLDAPLLAQLPQLRLICTASTGTDQLDLEACEARGISVRHAGRYSRPSVVQITWALILELTCQLQLRRQQVLSGAWQRSPVFALVEPAFDELAGRHLTVMGAGDIGRSVAAVGEAFGMTVHPITSRTPAKEMEQALRQADVVTLHAPLSAASRHLINAERLAWMKASAVLVNMGRGGLIDTPALVRVLQEGALAGAALDVLEREPPGPELEPLKAVPNLILTPHIGWASRQARERLVATLAAHLAAFRQDC